VKTASQEKAFRSLRAVIQLLIT